MHKDALRAAICLTCRAYDRQRLRMRPAACANMSATTVHVSDGICAYVLHMPRHSTCCTHPACKKALLQISISATAPLSCAMPGMSLIRMLMRRQPRFCPSACPARHQPRFCHEPARRDVSRGFVTSLPGETSAAVLSTSLPVEASATVLSSSLLSEALSAVLSIRLPGEMSAAVFALEPIQLDVSRDFVHEHSH